MWLHNQIMESTKRTKYSLCTSRMILCSLGFFAVQRILPYSRTSSVSFFSTVENGRSQCPSWSWKTHSFTTLDILSRFVTILESSWLIYLFIRQILTQLEIFFSSSSNTLLDITGATSKKTGTKVLIPFLIGVLTMLEQEKRVLETIFGTRT